MRKGFIVLACVILMATAAAQAQPASRPGGAASGPTTSAPVSKPTSQPAFQGVFRDPAMQPAIPASRPDVRTACYMGESIVSAPDGKPVGTMIVALCREFLQSEKKIVETMVVVHPRDPTRIETTIYLVDGDKVTSAPGGKWTVAGELRGPAWHWSGMKYTFKLNDGTGSVVGEEKGDDNLLQDERKFLGPDGAVRVLIHDQLHRITSESFILFKRRFMPEASAASQRSPASRPGATQPLMGPPGQPAHPTSAPGGPSAGHP